VRIECNEQAQPAKFLKNDRALERRATNVETRDTRRIQVAVSLVRQLHPANCLDSIAPVATK
jgi:hypothetical protein